MIVEPKLVTKRRNSGNCVYCYYDDADNLLLFGGFDCVNNDSNGPVIDAMKAA